MKIEKDLNALLNAISINDAELLEKLISTIDLNQIAELVLTRTFEPNMIPYEDLLNMVLTITQFIDTETGFDSPITDENYDKLHAEYVKLTGSKIVGTNIKSMTNKPLKEHSYPELRGSLDKVHFLTKEEVPEKDSRTSLEEWANKINKLIPVVESDEPLDNTVPTMYQPKYDGLSAVFECQDDQVVNILTRKDVDNNVGVDITHILPHRNVREFFPFLEKYPEITGKYGIKTEIIMKLDDLEEFKKTVPKPPKNHRSAVSMILNTSAEEYNKEWFKYLTIKPLQVSTEVRIDTSDNKRFNLDYLYEIDGRHQYIVAIPVDDDSTRLTAYVDDDSTRLTAYDDYSDLFNAGVVKNNFIEFIKGACEDMKIPIDGVVISIRKPELNQMIGRKDNINQFQIAYKFPAGIAKTTLESVEFCVGPTAGTITPVAHVTPVVIMGNTIDSVNLSNMNKLERLKLRIGDEVKIKYDIIPTLFKDSECESFGGKSVRSINICPICGVRLTHTEDKLQSRCMNPDCGAKIAGKIYNYIVKMNIPNMGLGTVQSLSGHGYLHSISDLYRLYQHREELEKLPSYGPASVKIILDSIKSVNKAYLHDILGSIGIPDIGRRIMKKVLTSGLVTFDDLLSNDIKALYRMNSIEGIGMKTADKLMSGIAKHRHDIEEILNYVEIIPYEDSGGDIVIFTKVRDKKFSEFLESTGKATVADGYNKSVDVVIVPDMETTSEKITKAKADGKLIITLDEAHKRYGYNV